MKETKKNIIKSLKDIKLNDIIKEYEELKKLDFSNNSKLGNKIVDYFTFEERLKTVGRGGISFFDFIENEKYYMKKNYIKKLYQYSRNKNISHYKSLYHIFNLYYGSINIFKPTISIKFYEIFKPKRILDFTMGWGGRLIGASILNIPEYIGIDMNKNLIKPYEKMISFLKPRTSTKIKLIFDDALNIDYSKLNYDFVFTSPPYYNIELYTGTSKKTKDEWDETFYKPLFMKTYNNLQKGGYYCLNIPIELYKRVCIKLLGKYNKRIELIKTSRNIKQQKEYIYIWYKK